MGYDTYITGELTFSPPLSKAKTRMLRDGQVLAGSIFEEQEGFYGRDVEYGIDENECLDTITIDGSFRAYYVDDEIEKLIDFALPSLVNGVLHGDGDESDDFWRITVENSKARSETVQMLYDSELEEIKREAYERGRMDGRMAEGNGYPREEVNQG